MDIINAYLSGLLFTKVESKDGYAIYAALLSGALGADQKQYFLLFVPEHLAIASKCKAGEIPWKSMQARQIKYGYDKLVKQHWDIKKLPNPIFRAEERTDRYTKYFSEDGFPLEMILINDIRRKSKYQYNERMNLIAAINTWQCVISESNEIKMEPVSDISHYHGKDYEPDVYFNYATPQQSYKTLDQVNHNTLLDPRSSFPSQPDIPLTSTPLRVNTPMGSTAPLFNRQPIFKQKVQPDPDIEFL